MNALALKRLETNGEKRRLDVNWRYIIRSLKYFPGGFMYDDDGLEGQTEWVSSFNGRGAMQ